MTIVGRITKDAVVNQLKDDRKVVNFSVAVNDSYKPKDGERIRVATYYNCSYWMSEKIAGYLKKGSLVEVAGRIEAKAFPGGDGMPKASLNCHVSNIKIHVGPKEVEANTLKAEPTFSQQQIADDLPF